MSFPSRLRALLLALVLLASGAAACAVVPTVGEPAASPHTAPRAQFQVTSPTVPGRTLTVVPPSPDSTPSVTLDVHLDEPQQEWWGAGAALTDSSVQLLQGRPGAVSALFDPDAAQGARLTMVRLPLSGTDFSASPWTWQPGEPAPREQVASARLLRQQVLPLQPRTRVVGAPWTAPPSMKTSSSPRGGALSDSGVDAYGDLLVRQARWLARHHVPLWATTLGNEPGYSSDYPTMTMTDDQMVRLADEVGPRLDGLGVRLWAVDHNWSDRARVDAVTSQSAAFDGAAFHCYGGSPDQMAGLVVPRMVTECTGTTDTPASTFGWDAQNLVARAVAAGSSGLMMWNLALDPAHGPVDQGSRWGCKTCRGLVTVTTSGFYREPEFYVLAHLSRAASPGARVLPTSGASTVLSTAAFRNSDGTVGVFGQNRTGTTQTVRITTGTTSRTYVVGPGELFSYRAPAP
ncbi:glycoside hydrolase family 30 protein [Nocardioides mangrovi]|uniref:glycoside hydrolase family 30 protein n=1 Tax=Nocardioides mangrovi TaxID=2874580 RepID=UPI0021E136F8|nr:glycoside hydrolase family 30 protein [Nocardioides mangrovi]